MKPYFAKYLPVKGDIKQGDDVITITGFLKKYDDLVALEAPTKVKLFLCSRDIQVGDRIRQQFANGISDEEYSVDNPILTETVNLYKDGKWNHQSHISNLFKVIGEISPEAKWVKEGDEFDEYRQNYACEKGNECDLFYGDQVCSAPHDIKLPIMLKGPCGHFH